MTITPKKRKILYLITKGNWGGAQRYVFDLATSLPRGEFEPVVACDGTGILAEKLRGADIRTVFLPSLQRAISFGKELKALHELVRLFKAEKPDIIHLNSSKAAGLGSLAASLYKLRIKDEGLRIIFTVHGWPFKEDRLPFVRLMLYVATWFTVLLSHNTIVVSKQDEALGKGMWLASRKIRYIPLALKATDEILERQKAEKRLSFGLSGNTAYRTPCRLVTIAELTKNKGVLPYGVEMIRKLEHDSPGTYSYTVFGEGEDLPELQRRSAGLPIYFESVMKYTGRPSDLSTNASRYLKAFDIVVLPSIKEGMPYVLLEAAAAGLPMVATDVVREETATLSNIRFVSPRNGHALASAIQNLKKGVPAKTEGAARSFPVMLKQTVALYQATR